MEDPATSVARFFLAETRSCDAGVMVLEEEEDDDDDDDEGI
jgi:hypothetical protein